MIVLFDCDGTLVDSEHSHYLGWKHALSRFDIPFSIEDYIPYVGLPATEISQALAQKLNKNCAEELRLLKNDCFLTLINKGIPPITSVVNFLSRLIAEKVHDKRIKIGVCSAARKQEILIHLKHLNVLDKLDVVLSGHEDLEGYNDPEGVNKPKPYIYLHAMKLLGASPEETIAIEDSFLGVCSATSAGCFTVAVPNFYTRSHDFSRANLCLASLDDFNPKNLANAVSL